MSFAENLKQLRKEKGLSQEEFAEIMNVSRQAVSKWEQGESFPEVEKLLFLSSKFNVSLDYLMSAEIVKEQSAERNTVTGNIIIYSRHENVVTTCYKVMASQKMNGGKKSPQYALFGVGNGGNSFWGEATVFLGWYADYEQIAKEMNEIQQAMIQGIASYELRYNSKVERKWLKIIMVEE